MTEQCDNCRYWRDEGMIIDDLEFGTCRRGAPRLGELIQLQPAIPDGRIMRRGNFPWMPQNEWCGQFKKIKKPVDPSSG